MSFPAELPIPVTPETAVKQGGADGTPPFELSEEDLDILRAALPQSTKGREHDCLAWYRALPQLVADGEIGRFALIHGGQLISVWDTHDDVIQAGYDKYGDHRLFITPKIEQRELDRLHLFLAQERARRCRN